MLYVNYLAFILMNVSYLGWAIESSTFNTKVRAHGDADGHNFIYETGAAADFQANRNVSVIAFGSCSKHTYAQPLWRRIAAQNPDLWIWLGDAVYADTRLMPFVWMVATLPEMQKRYHSQKYHPDYQDFLKTKVPVIGVWDDHDFGSDFGTKHFIYRLRVQDMFLDFLDEPLDSIRRKREGTFASYQFGSGNRKIKIILLDVRSNAEPSYPCDVLGDRQWKWLEEQLRNDVTELTIIGSGMQIVSDIPFIEKWQRCPSSLDKLVWLTQKRDHVFFLSGDVHFSEVNCMNSSSSGYPLYEVTSSSMTHSCSSSLLPYGVCDWTLKNVVASCFRVTKVITDTNFGVIRINWYSNPIEVSFEIHGEHGILSSLTISAKDLERKRVPASCPTAIEQPNWYWKRVFWISVILLGFLAFCLLLWLTIIVFRWFLKEVLKDIDLKIKNGFVKLRKKKLKSE